MDVQQVLPLTTILLLGAFHGINPGLGWLFAVALGMQERRLGAVWRAPLTLGHGLAIGAVVLVALVAGVVVPAASLKLPVAATLGALGAYRLIRHGHFTGGGMRVGMGGLTTWSFLMATCHGARLMVLPVFLGMAAPVEGASCHVPGAASSNAAMAVTATLVHGAGYPDRDCGGGLACVHKSRCRHTKKPAEFVELFRRFYGPAMNAFEAAEKSGTASELHTQLVELANAHNKSTNGGTSIPATFLRVTIHV